MEVVTAPSRMPLSFEPLLRLRNCHWHVEWRRSPCQPTCRDGPLLLQALYLPSVPGQDGTLLSLSFLPSPLLKGQRESQNRSFCPAPLTCVRALLVSWRLTFLVPVRWSRPLCRALHNSVSCSSTWNCCISLKQALLKHLETQGAKKFLGYSSPF